MWYIYKPFYDKYKQTFVIYTSQESHTPVDVPVLSELLSKRIFFDEKNFCRFGFYFQGSSGCCGQSGQSQFLYFNKSINHKDSIDEFLKDKDCVYLC